MPQSLYKVFLHIVFSTKHRKPMIDEQIESEMFKYISGICQGLKCPPVQVGGYLNHIHVVCGLGKQTALIDLLQSIKQNSSLWIKKKGSEYSQFYWQDGYAAFSVSPKDLDRVAEYVRNQKQHHQKISFQDEYRQLLIEHGLEVDERYAWD